MNTENKKNQTGSLFEGLLFLLRERGIAVSTTEWLLLLQALQKGLAFASLYEFYCLCRAILIKNEKDYTVFHTVFTEYFNTIQQHSADGIPSALKEWLKTSDNDTALSDRTRAKRNAFLSNANIQEMLKQRLEEQKEAHNRGSYWIGTKGVSVFGNSGFSPKGIHAGVSSRYKRAFQTIERPEYHDFREDQVLNVRQFQIAFRRLRQFSARLNTAPPEFDLKGTIQATSNNGGHLKITYTRPRKNTIKLLLLMDSGGSMEYYSHLCAALFQAVHKTSYFKDLKIYYFHNCIYARLCTEPSLLPVHMEETERVINHTPSDYRVILIGDAMMEPSELLGGSEFTDESTIILSGLDWLRRFKTKYPHIVWLNPAIRPSMEGYLTKTYDLLQKEFYMYPLSIKGMEQAFQKLLENK